MGTIYVPNKDDGRELYITPPVGFMKVANYLGGYLHNGCEVGILQTDEDEDVFGGANLYGNGSAWAAVVAAGFNNHINGTNGVWLQWEKAGANNTCHVKEGVALPVGTVLTEAEYNQFVRWAGDPSCGDGVVDF